MVKLETKIWALLLLEPYRIFFPIGWVMGLAGGSYWVLVSTGLIGNYLPLYHGLIQIELFCAAFAVGFLLTALPKFLATRAASKNELIAFVAVYLCLALADLGNFFPAGQWFFIVFLILLVRFAAVRVADRKSAPPFSFLLIAFGLLEGLLGAVFILIPLQRFPLLGSKLLEQGMLLSLSLGVGSFLGPRLMGVVDTQNAVVSLPSRARNGKPWYHSPALAVLAIGTVIFASFFIECGWDRFIGLSLRAAATGYCLFRFGVIRIPRSQSIIGILTAIPLWFLPIGLFLALIFPTHEAGMLHLTYIGGFGLLILAIGAQVVSSHGMVHQFWQTHRVEAMCVAALMCAAAITRAIATVFPTHYFALLAVAAIIFDLAMLTWGVGVLRHIGSAFDKRIKVELPPIAHHKI